MNAGQATGETRVLREIFIDKIRILNPRDRNRAIFLEMVDSIAKVGLKRPITVSSRKCDADPFEYDLVCGQGRIEAFKKLGQTTIPAIIIQAEESDCLVMSLVENCARRQHRAIDLLEDISTLRNRGYSDLEIASKIGLSVDYVRAISSLLAKGEERLVSAVENGILPLRTAIEIAKCDDADVQQALTHAYSENKLRGGKLMAVRRIIEQRRRQGKHLHGQSFGRRDSSKRPVTADSMVRMFREEADRHRLLLKKSEMTQSLLMFAIEAIGSLREEREFVRLLRLEDLLLMPAFLEERLAKRSTQ